MNIYSSKHAFNADSYNPVLLYRQLRHKFRKVCLLESNDYNNRSDSKSFLGLDPIVEITYESGIFKLETEGQLSLIEPIIGISSSQQLQILLDSYQMIDGSKPRFFGRISFEFSHEENKIQASNPSDSEIPEIHLFLFRYVIQIDHFKDEGFIIKQSFTDCELETEEIHQLLRSNNLSMFPFELLGDEQEEKTEFQFKNMVEKAQEHCRRGDVFQMVLSNSYKQAFFGDDFEVYRSLRRLNPSPYLFYFDFEDYRLFGSSPEAQLKIIDGKAEIHPIAGTVVKSGIIEDDQKNIAFLKQDEKENSEHVMLVDLARNDLSRFCTNVRIEKFKEIQHFSHVYHIVSHVTAKSISKQTIPILSASFPAGTLSGAPKNKALELIARYETSRRDFYGGAIGMLESKGDLNMAIVIRSLLSKNNVLHYRAGAGIVLDSIPEKEYQEVQHKLRAVRTAIKQAQNKNKEHENCNN